MTAGDLVTSRVNNEGADPGHWMVIDTDIVANPHFGGRDNHLLGTTLPPPTDIIVTTQKLRVSRERQNRRKGK